MPEQHYARRGRMTASALEVALEKRLAPLSGGAGQQAAVTVGYVAAGIPCLTPVVIGQEAAQDDSTVAWLLARSLAERQREEKESKEAAELDQLEERLREVALELIREVERVRRPGDTTHLTQLLKRTVSWYTATRTVLEWKDARGLVKKKKKRKKRRRKLALKTRWRLSWSLFSCSS